MLRNLTKMQRLQGLLSSGEIEYERARKQKGATLWHKQYREGDPPPADLMDFRLMLT